MSSRYTRFTSEKSGLGVWAEKLGKTVATFTDGYLQTDDNIKINYTRKLCNDPSTGVKEIDRHGNDINAEGYEVPPEAHPVPAVEPDPVEGEEVDLDSLSKKELVAMAEDRGIQVPDRANKDTLKDLIMDEQGDE